MDNKMCITERLKKEVNCAGKNGVISRYEIMKSALKNIGEKLNYKDQSVITDAISIIEDIIEDIKK